MGAFHRKRRLCRLGDQALSEVVTIQEAMKIAHTGYSTLHYHITHGNINARKTDRVYLISLKSLLSYYNLEDKHQQNS